MGTGEARRSVARGRCPAGWDGSAADPVQATAVARLMTTHALRGTGHRRAQHFARAVNQQSQSNVRREAVASGNRLQRRDAHRQRCGGRLLGRYGTAALMTGVPVATRAAGLIARSESSAKIGARTPFGTRDPHRVSFAPRFAPRFAPVRPSAIPAIARPSLLLRDHAALSTAIRVRPRFDGGGAVPLSPCRRCACREAFP